MNDSLREVPLSFPWPLVGQGFCLVSLIMMFLWLVQVRTRDASPVDVAWTYGLGLLAVFLAWRSEGDLQGRILVGVLGGLWSLRLGTYLLLNRVIGKSEDGRYQTLRESWGKHQHRNFFLFFQAQAVLDSLFALSFIPAVSRVTPLSLEQKILALCIWSVSVAGEMIADAQLAAFRRNPANRGRTCRKGLWNYSRHPNYFFEWLHWWTYVILAWNAPFFLSSLIAPIVLLYLLFKVTGIPATEAQAVKSRGADYLEYQRTTSAFIPWFPRKLENH